MDTARAQWELENDVEAASESDEASLFRYDEAQQKKIQEEKPWKQNPNYFKHVRVSALALIKMTMHCRSGGELEVMGMLQAGKTVGDTFVVLDAFALPVEGTETRVNAQAEAYEYMVDFVQASRDHGRREHVVGWYHSHPGYGCWMSGIDCSTQLLNQQYTEPFLAIVIDPVRTCAAGKVEIGAFRTYPQGYKGATGGDPENGGGAGGGGGGGGGYQTIPMDKIEDFGVHANQYYRLDVSFFKSRLDAEMLDVLWNKYWVNTLSSSPARANRAFVATQIEDLARKMTHAESHPGGTTAGRGGMGGLFIRGGGAGAARRAMEENALGKIAADGAKVTIEHAKGAATQAIKDAVFNRENGLGRVKVFQTNEADDADRGGDVVMT